MCIFKRRPCRAVPFGISPPAEQITIGKGTGTTSAVDRSSMRAAFMAMGWRTYVE
jgi:hypothetical protein